MADSRERKAQSERERAAKVRSVVLDAYGGDEHGADEFLCRRHAMLGGETPLNRAVTSDAGAEEVIALIGRALYSGGV